MPIPAWVVRLLTLASEQGITGHVEFHLFRGEIKTAKVVREVRPEVEGAK